MYVINNRVTGENMTFHTMQELREFWQHLTIDEMGQWSGWIYVD